MMEKRKKHKVYHKTNPKSLPNPYNYEPRILLLGEDGQFVQMVSQIVAFRLLRGDAAELVMVSEPTIRLKIPTSKWQELSEVPQKCQTRMRKFLQARRTILYGNYHIVGPNGETMFHCNNQKALWYINRGLTEVVSVDPPVLKLRFIPDGPGHINDAYYITPKINQCVVCGSQIGLNRHHVVPSLYRKYMGMEIKSHSYHDVLLMCLECHENYEAEADKLKLKIAKEYEIPLSARYHVDTGEDYRYDTSADTAVKAAHALLRHSDRIPADRILVLRESIKEYLGHDPSQEDIAQLSKKGFPKSRKSHDYMDHGEMVVRRLDGLEDFQKFTQRWREHFLNTMKPKFLPANWSLNKSILPEDYEPDGDGPVLLHERVRETT